jgi:hypothetical protein
MAKEEIIQVIEQVTVLEESFIPCPEHEVWLSFCNDSGAELFLNWWYTTGHAAFQEYCKEELEKSNG